MGSPAASRRHAAPYPSGIRLRLGAPDAESAEKRGSSEPRRACRGEMAAIVQRLAARSFLTCPGPSTDGSPPSRMRQASRFETCFPLVVEDILGDVAGPRKTGFGNPGAAFAHSNRNYILLGAVAEKQSGRIIRDLYLEVIGKPPGLSLTTFCPLNRPRRRLAPVSIAPLYRSPTMPPSGHVSRVDILSVARATQTGTPCCRLWRRPRRW